MSGFNGSPHHLRKEGRNHTCPITSEMIQQARENLILRHEISRARNALSGMSCSPDGSISTSCSRPSSNSSASIPQHWVERFDYERPGRSCCSGLSCNESSTVAGESNASTGSRRKRTDLLIIRNYPYEAQRVVLDLEVSYNSPEKVVRAG